jgi:putative phage-type endonuclease
MSAETIAKKLLSKVKIAPKPKPRVKVVATITKSTKKPEKELGRSKTSKKPAVGAQEIPIEKPADLPTEKPKRKPPRRRNAKVVSPRSPPKLLDDSDSLPDKVEFALPEHLVSHRHDFDGKTFEEGSNYLRRKNRIMEIKEIPQHEQGTQAWLDQRMECITATGIAVALDEEPYSSPWEFLKEKVLGRKFIENKNVHHGKKYEEIGAMHYGFRNHIKVAEYGLIQHDTHKFIGASPDGICEKSTPSGTLSKLVGRLLEIKFPTSREILTEGELDGDIVPHYYYWQILAQLYVTKMDECDFLQCKIEEYESWEAYKADSQKDMPGLSAVTNYEKGCLIQLLPKKMLSTDPEFINKEAGETEPAKAMIVYNAKYIYPPKMHMTFDEIQKWIASEVMNYHNHKYCKDYMIDRIIYWRLSKVTCTLVKSDNARFEEALPKLKQFWSYVEFYREHKDLMNSMVDFVKDLDTRTYDLKSDIIFERIHKQYTKYHPNELQPLYQEKNKWRKKYDQKASDRSKKYGGRFSKKII